MARRGLLHLTAAASWLPVEIPSGCVHRDQRYGDSKPEVSDGVVMSDARVPRIPAAMVSPSLNRGIGFTHEQRRQLGLTGRLRSAVLTLDEQADRVWHQLQGMATDLSRDLLLEQSHCRHELLYYKVLGIIVAGARLLTTHNLHSAAKAVAKQAIPASPRDSLLPDVQNLCTVSAAVAEAVYPAAVDDGVATKTHDDIAQTVHDTMWHPAYD
jgi:Malic enzyme, NAD binding domain